MKTKNIIVAGVVLAAVGAAGLTQAGMPNKYAQYRATVEATKGTVAPESRAWKHLNKFAREQAEKSGIGNTILPSVETVRLPKNFRNSY